MESITNVVISLLLYFSTPGYTIFDTIEGKKETSYGVNSHTVWLLPTGFLNFDAVPMQKDTVIHIPDSLQTEPKEFTRGKK